MARPKGYDLEAALDNAVKTFWEKGYEATSIQDLVDSMGIQRASLYSAFGSKQKLFLAVLDRYGDIVVSQLVEALESHDSGKESIRLFFQRVIDQIMSTGPWRGCLITNSAVEIGFSDLATKEKVTYLLGQIEQGFYQTLVRAKSAGEIDEQDLHAMARYFTGCLQGLLVIGKVCPERSRLEDIVKIALAALDAKPELDRTT